MFCRRHGVPLHGETLLRAPMLKICTAISFIDGRLMAAPDRPNIAGIHETS
jgi:hypothetical protein